MEERYEIKGKIGHGGLGTIYRAQDLRMNREVAIKRIISNASDPNLSSEATRQLIKEAGALASLQHPNIVTIYDVGSDEDGPYVVMELLTGECLEDIITKASFTWEDFRQLALQTMEALIAANDLNLIHRDLKPSNIMLTWLPSGKFQIKIVDFGLAKLSASPSRQTLDQSDGIFGSIYFMAPEQFEHALIDHRVDIYAIGCVFYYALTGIYPFDGESAANVMASHLQHHVKPLQDVREGIPLWVCDWVMWHINRQPSDRPESPRESLRVFLENDAQLSPPLSKATHSILNVLPNPSRLIVPGAIPALNSSIENDSKQLTKTVSIPKALVPPTGSKPSIHSTHQILSRQNPTGINPMPYLENSDAKEIPTLKVSDPKASTANNTPNSQKTSILLAPPPSSKNTIILTKKISQMTDSATSNNPPPLIQGQTQLAVNTAKKGLTDTTKIIVSVIAFVIVILLAIVFLKKRAASAEAQIFNEMIRIAADRDSKELPVNKKKLNMLLSTIAHTGAIKHENRNAVYRALYLAKAIDDINVDQYILDFATTKEILLETRYELLRTTLAQRNNPSIIEQLLNFIKTTKDEKAKHAALQAIENMANDADMEEFIELIKSSQQSSITQQAEKNALTVIKKSNSKQNLEKTIIKNYESSAQDDVRHALLRLLGHINLPNSQKILFDNLKDPKKENQIAAIVALGNTFDYKSFLELIGFLQSNPAISIRARAYTSALKTANALHTNREEIWKKLATETKTQAENSEFIRHIANLKPEPWAFTILQNIVANNDDKKIKDLAERAIVRLNDVKNTKLNNKEIKNSFHTNNG